MILNVPNLRRLKLLHLLVCASFSGADFPAETLAQWEEPAVLPLRRGKVNEYLRARLHKTSKGVALHVEVVGEEWFDDGPPKRRRTQRDVDGMTRAVLDKSGSALIGGSISVKKSELPEGSIVRAASVSVESTAVSMEVIGSRFRIRGTPFQFLEWAVTDEKKGVVTVSLVANQKVTVTPALLSNQASFLRSGFDTLIFGKSTNA